MRTHHFTSHLHLVLISILAGAACGPAAEPQGPAQPVPPPQATSAKPTPPQPPAPPRSTGSVDPYLDTCSKESPKPSYAVEVLEGEVKIRQKIHFDVDKATIRSESAPLIARIAYELEAHPNINLVEVAGHADESGSEARNRTLTRERAQAVMDALVKNGVQAQRVRAVGYSSYCPVDSAKTEEAFAKNRRVELKILQQDGQPTKVAWGGCAAAEKNGIAKATLPPPTSSSSYVPAPQDLDCEPPLRKAAWPARAPSPHVLDPLTFFGITSSEIGSLSSRIGDAETSVARQQGRLCYSLAKKKPRVYDLNKLARKLAEAAAFGAPHGDALIKRAITAHLTAIDEGSERDRMSNMLGLGRAYRLAGMRDASLATYLTVIDGCDPVAAIKARASRAFTRMVFASSDKAQLELALREATEAHELALAYRKYQLEAIGCAKRGSECFMYDGDVAILGWVLTANGKRVEAKKLFDPMKKATVGDGPDAVRTRIASDWERSASE